MNRLLIVSVICALLAISAEGFRVPRQVDEEEGTITKFTEAIKSYYNGAVTTASGYLDNIKGLQLEEKIKNLYTDTRTAASTYAGIAQDQIYHFFYPQQ
ncbi:apolipoprotein C-II [Gouania willdenowi]|uniref:Apolipoprotein C-II n=1 Tax=Gouania willdenowi TaxID=441366 RepID=A0A8C5END1_GOUWI|nr:apolipoprotein C-II [Gouania willdenowi]XP_028326618.1 apolipoprotein C-II [Gouania willdenowi]